MNLSVSSLLCGEWDHKRNRREYSERDNVSDHSNQAMQFHGVSCLLHIIPRTEEKLVNTRCVRIRILRRDQFARAGCFRQKADCAQSRASHIAHTYGSHGQVAEYRAISILAGVINS